MQALIHDQDESVRRNQMPIIVGGCPRSGTSLVRRLLNAHPRIHCGPEVKFFRDFFGDYPRDELRHVRFMATARSLLPEDELLTILGQAFVRVHERAAERAGKPRWADKSPDNALYLDKWHALLGDEWLFVHVLRNPLDTLASIKEAGFPQAIPPDLNSRIELYRRYVKAGAEFRVRFPDRYFPIGYERLVRSPREQLDRLMEWMDEKAVEDQFDFNAIDQGVGLEDPKIGSTSAIHDRSVGRWALVLLPHEADLIREQLWQAWTEALPGSEELVAL